MAGALQVPVTREGALSSLKLLMIVLAAVIIWQSASALNAGFQDRDLVTVPPFTRGLSKLFIGTDTTAPFSVRSVEYWHANHRLISLGAIMVAVTLLITRYLVLGRVLDYMYVESYAADKRIYSGFVAHIFLMLIHAGMLYGVALCARDPRQAALTPQMLMGVFLFNTLWAIVLYATSRRPERRHLRGLPFVAFTSALTMLLLGMALWRLEMARPALPAERDSVRVLIAAMAGSILCFVDAAIQSRVYCRRVPAPLQ